MICNRCGKEIKVRENYIQVINFDNNKLIDKKFFHKTCWDLFIDTRETTHGVLNMAKKLMSKVNKSGLMEEEDEKKETYVMG